MAILPISKIVISTVVTKKRFCPTKQIPFVPQRVSLCPNLWHFSRERSSLLKFGLSSKPPPPLPPPKPYAYA